MSDATLSSWLAPMAKQEFLGSYWRKKPLLLAGDAKRLELVSKALGTIDVRELMRKSSSVKVWQDDGPDINDPPVDVAMGWHDKGNTIYCNLKRKEPIYEHVNAISRELGEVSNSALLAVFAVKGSRGSTPHFDRYDTLTIQLSGTKRWRVAPSDFFVKNPERNWAMGTPPPPFADVAKVPNAMPDDATEFELTPGSLLYVPAGYLHYATAGTEASVSCNITIPTVLWFEAMTKIIGFKLAQHERMRQSIVGLFGDGWNRGQLAHELPIILEKLQKTVASLTVEELVKIASDEALLKMLK